MFARVGGGNSFIVNDGSREPRKPIMVLLVTRRTSGVGRRMESMLALLQLRKRQRIEVRRVDADARPGLVRRLGVDEVPSIVVLDDQRHATLLRGRVTLADVEHALPS